jgi:hypothetical protein
VFGRTERAIALDVRQRGRGELEVAEATGELVLLVLGHVLAGEHEQRVFEPQLGQLGDCPLARVREEDIADDRPERRVQRLDPDRAPCSRCRPHDVAHAAMVRVGDCGIAGPKGVKIRALLTAPSVTYGRQPLWRREHIKVVPGRELDRDGGLVHFGLAGSRLEAQPCASCELRAEAPDDRRGVTVDVPNRCP